jgi:hypothetical protein
VPQRAEVEGGPLLAAGGLRSSGARGDGLLQPAHLGADGRVEEVEIADPLMLLGEPRQLRLDAGAPRGRLAALEALQDLAIAHGELLVVPVAGLVEELPDLGRRDVLDLVDADERRVAALALRRRHAHQPQEQGILVHVPE